MEAPDSDSGGEAIMICIDNSIQKPEYYEAQLKAVRSYATYKIQSDPRTVVGISTSSRTPIHDPDLRVLLDPTRDLNLIFNSFQRIVRGGKFDMIEAIINCLGVLPFPFSGPPEKRIVMFAGGIVSMAVEVADEFGTCLKKKGIAFDIVNFTLGDKLDLRKKKLEAFVAAVNNNDNSHIIHVDEKSSLSNLLSRFMGGDEHVEANGMKNTDHQLIHSKTSSMKNKATENGNVDVKQPSSSSMDKGTENKDYQLIHSKTSRLSSKKKATGIENVDVKRESEPSSSFMAKGMKNKDHQLIHSKTSRLSIKKKATENASSKGGVDHEYVKNTPFKLRNRFEAFSIST